MECQGRLVETTKPQKTESAEYPHALHSIVEVEHSSVLPVTTPLTGSSHLPQKVATPILPKRLHLAAWKSC